MLTGRLPRKQLLVALMVLFTREFAGMAGTGLYDINRRPSADFARRFGVSSFPRLIYHRDKSGAKKRKRLRYRYYVCGLTVALVTGVPLNIYRSKYTIGVRPLRYHC